MPDVVQHPSSAELAAFVAGRLPVDQQRALERHVGECSHCCDVLANLPEDTLVARLHENGGSATFEGAIRSAGRADPATVEIPPELIDHPRYRVVRCLGVGGMGAAFLAEHRRMDRPVVLKIVRRELLTDPQVADRFQREVRAAARLSHPNIVQAYDADQAGELHFLVMEYVEGRTLAEVVAKHGPLPVAHACHYARQAAAGLRHAHEKGMVHRDVKPQNLMLTPSGQVKILDFGLAQFARELAEPASAHGAVTTTLRDAESLGSVTMVTAAGTIFGTPDYIAPEQAVDSRGVDIRADVYSLGCTLFFLLQGRPPFPEGSAREKLAAHRTRPIPPLADVREPIPAELARVVERMSAKSPADRYATPDEVAKALAPFVKSPPPKVESTDAPAVVLDRPAKMKDVPQAKRRRWPIVVGIAAVAVVAGLTGYLLRNRDSRHPTAESKAPAPISPLRVPSNIVKMMESAKRAETAKPGAVLVLLPLQFQSADYVDARRVLEADAGITVRVASTGSCRPLDAPASDVVVTPDLVLPNDALRAIDYDALYLVGGNIHVFKDAGPVRDVVWKVIDEFLAAEKPIAAIGTGQGILAFRGMLADRTVSASPTVAQFLPRYAANLKNDPVVVDGSLLTAGESQGATALAKKLAALVHYRTKPTTPLRP